MRLVEADEMAGADMASPLKYCVAAILGLTVPVQDNAQDVDPFDLPMPSPVREKKDPKVVIESVKRALQESRDVPAGAVSAVVHAETIVLTGEVTTEVQAARALSIAEQSAQGVRVASHVTIASAGATATAAVVPALVRSVEAALRSDRRTANLGVVVSIDGQDVIGLHGLVPTRESRSAAEEVAGRVEGVGRVSSRLVVAGE